MKMTSCFLIAKTRLVEEKKTMLKYLNKDMEHYQVEEIVYKAYGTMLESCWERIGLDEAHEVRTAPNSSSSRR